MSASSLLDPRLWEMSASAGNLARETKALSNVLARALGSHRLGLDADELWSIDNVSETIKDKTADLCEQIEDLHKLILELTAAAQNAGGQA